MVREGVERTGNPRAAELLAYGAGSMILEWPAVLCGVGGERGFCATKTEGAYGFGCGRP